jgi:hypothetical protein
MAVVIELPVASGVGVGRVKDRALEKMLGHVADAAPLPLV